jgi:hypothetical protein
MRRFEGQRQGFPAVDFAHLDLPRGPQRPEQHRHGLGAGQHGLRLDAAAKLLVQTFDGVGRARRFRGHEDKIVTKELESGYDETEVQP